MSTHQKSLFFLLAFIGLYMAKLTDRTDDGEELKLTPNFHAAD